MKRFENRTLDKKLDEYIQDARTLLLPNSKMMLDLGLKNDFGYESGAGFIVVWAFKDCSKVAPVYFYKPFNPWTKAIGYSDGKAIHLNSRVFSNLSRVDVIGLLLHEYCHIAGFNHGTGRTRNYKTEDKCLYSVPYFVSENVGKWI